MNTTKLTLTERQQRLVKYFLYSGTKRPKQDGEADFLALSAYLIIGHFGPVIDEPVAHNINTRYGLKPGDKLSDEHLRDLEQRTGIASGALTYTTDGRLMIKGAGGKTNYRGGYYATESGVDTTKGKRFERPALYSLYRACGFDPCNPAIIWKRT